MHGRWTAILLGAALAVLGATPAEAAINCGGNTGLGWKRHPESGAGIWKVTAVNVGCRAARRVAQRSYPVYDGPVDTWSYRGWRCREIATDYEYSKARCRRGCQVVTWEGGA